MRLLDKVALVTGAGGGIGSAIARRFVAEGAKVCLTDLREDMLAPVVASLPEGTTAMCPGDVTKLDDVREMVRVAVEFGGKLDVLVNCAGLDTGGDVVTMTEADWERLHAVNLDGPFLTAKVALPEIVAAGGGSIVNVASLAGLRCVHGMAGYSSSKGGLIMLTKGIAVDYGPKKVRCNAVCPGPVRTGLLDLAMTGFGERLGLTADQVFERATSVVPLGRPAHPDEIAAACLFLASDESSFVTGAELMVDGGLSAVDPFSIGLQHVALRRD
jgi:meso-butanediol dehydrogenase / (S,S)-butanediol dehydrogenase / diacetyl reductase